MGLGNFMKQGLKTGFTGRTGVIGKEADRLGVGKRLGQMKTVGNLAMDIGAVAMATGVGGEKTQALLDAGTKVQDYGKKASEMGQRAQSLEATTCSAAQGDVGAITSLALGGMNMTNRRK